MNDFLKVLLNIRSLRAAVRDLPFEQLEEIKQKFDAVIEERLEATEAERAARRGLKSNGTKTYAKTNPPVPMAASTA